MNPVLRIARAPGYTGPLPAYQTEGAAGLDLHAAAGIVVYPADGTIKIPTGIIVEIPEGYMGEVRGRSGLTAKGVNVRIGTIDRDYRGEISVILSSDVMFIVGTGDRIAQLVIVPVARCEVVEVAPADLSVTGRGAGGFGSTGDR